MAVAKLTESIIRAGASENSFQRGRDLFRGDAISNAAIQGRWLSGECEGNTAPFYKVRVELDDGGIRSANCTCPYDFGGYCKHMVALLLAYAHAPKQFTTLKEPADLLADLTREQLVALVTKLLRDQPDLYDRIEAAIALPSTTGKAKPGAAKRKKVERDVYRRRVRGIMHSLDRMRDSEAYWHVGGLVGELDGVRQTAMEFLGAGEPEAALEILLTLIEESHDGFDYIDDSNGELGDFLSSIGETLAEVILTIDLDEARRAEVLSELEGSHDKLSDYGIEGLEVAIAAARYGWGEVPHEESSGRTDEEDDDEDEWDEEDDPVSAAEGFHQFVPSWSPDYQRQALTRAKLNVLERQGRTEDYLALCKKAGAHLRYALKLRELGRVPEAVSYGLKNLTDASESLTLAQALREAGHLDEAIKVGERGLQLEGHKSALGEWLGPIEEAHGRTRQALEAWRVAFSDDPSLVRYQMVKRLAGARWKKLRPELMAILEKDYTKQPLAEVLLFEEEWDAAIKVADRDATDYRVVETVAAALVKHRPEWVIRASVKQAERLIAETKSKYYPAAAEWLRKAKAAYAQLGQTEKWRKYLQELKEEYKRRPALQAQLAKL